MPTLSELKAERSRVDLLLYSTWLREREEARRRIVEIAVEFQVSAATIAKDVEAAQRSASPSHPVLQPPKVEIPLRQQGLARHVAAKFRNAATGDTWSGRGSQPRWLREAIEAGAALEEFLVKDGFGDPADPLREFQDAARRGQLKGQQRPKRPR